MEVWEDCTWNFIWLLVYWNLPQVFSSKPESNHCIQIEASESQRGSGYEPVVH